MFDLIAEDITARKQLEEQLYQAQKMQAVGQLAGGVAHDFNNLLTVIGGQVEMILEGAEDSQLRARLARVQKAADRAGKLTRQLLAYSRRQVLQTRVVNLNTVIQHLLDLLGRLIKEHVTLDFQPAPELGWIRADPHQIEQVLINLTVNAQDAMPGGGRLTLATRNLRIGPGPGPDALEPGDYVQIIVRDNGHGMEREVQERVFEPFFTTRKFGEGTGLGLSMAYGIITQSGGAIRLESAPGEGCTFWITLPRTGPPEPGPGARPEPAAIPRGSETILLAEDEDGVRELIQDRLRGLGYTVLAAPDGLEAMAAALMYPGRIHLLLTDLVMPHADGRELAEELGKLAPKAKVIFMSGYPGHGVPGAALNLPAGHFLAKPVSLEALARTVRAVLDEKT
jgi:nitrogen-specific signal transduction histidine kinase/ActR/RegA family two-component response regulator